MNPTQQYRFNECTLTSYTQAKTFFERGRTPDKGRHLKNWARLHAVPLEGGSVAYEVRASSAPIVRFLPDNTLEFVCDMQTARSNSITLSQALQRAVPFYWIRVATGRYRVQHIMQMKYTESSYNAEHWYEDGHELRTKAPEFFEGIKFNLDTGECLNRQPDLLDNVNPKVRAEWLRDLKAFKKQVAVRAKVGAFDALLQETYQAQVNRKWEKPDWHKPEWIAKLSDCIKTQQVPMELMRGFAQSTSGGGYWSAKLGTGKDVIKTVDELCKELSVMLRRQYGVFDEPKTE